MPVQPAAYQCTELAFPVTTMSVPGSSAFVPVYCHIDEIYLPLKEKNPHRLMPALDDFNRLPRAQL